VSRPPPLQARNFHLRAAFSLSTPRPSTRGRETDGRRRMRYLLLWLIGIPLPILFIIWLLFN
jgi:hypothetical protein